MSPPDSAIDSYQSQSFTTEIYRLDITNNALQICVCLHFIIYSITLSLPVLNTFLLISTSKDFSEKLPLNCPRQRENLPLLLPLLGQKTRHLDKPIVGKYNVLFRGSTGECCIIFLFHICLQQFFF